MNDNSDTRRNILSAATHHFAKYGYNGTSMAKVAKKAGVSKSLIFWYFESKNKLFEALVERFVSACVTRLSRSHLGGTAVQEIDYLADVYWKFVEENLEFIRIFMSWFMQPDSVEEHKKEKLQMIHKRFEEVFCGYLEQGIKEGIFDANIDIPSTALAIVSSLEGLLIQLLVLGTDRERVDAAFHTLKNNILHGILVR